MPLLFALSDPPMPLYPTSKKYWGMWAPKKRRVRRGNGGTKGREGKKRGQMELSRDSNLIHRASKRQWRRRRRNYLFGAASQWNEKKIFFFSIYYGSTVRERKGIDDFPDFLPPVECVYFLREMLHVSFFCKRGSHFLGSFDFFFRNRKCETSTTTTRASVNLKVKEIFQVFQNWTKPFSRTNFPGIFIFVLCWISFLRVIERVSAKKEQWTQKKEFSLFFLPQQHIIVLPRKRRGTLLLCVFFFFSSISQWDFISAPPLMKRNVTNVLRPSSFF